MKEIISLQDRELELQLKKYASAKEAKAAVEKEAFSDFSESEDKAITVKQTYGDKDFEVEEKDE